MAKICMFTGKKTAFGRTRCHSMKQGKRKYKPNLLTRRVVLEDGMTYKMIVSAKAYKKMR